jgi:NADH-quinone oxidoreductase subunit J
MHDLLNQVVFYGFAALAILSAILVITQNNPVRCVLFLVVTFFASAVLWMMAQAEFLSLILVLVYVGAVMTLFLFVVMMLNIDVESMKSHFIRYLPFGLIVVALLTSLLLVAIPDDAFQSAATETMETQPTSIAILSNEPSHVVQKTIHSEASNTEALGMALFTKYVFGFELAAVLLLVAIVAAITLAHRGVTRSKKQDVVKQMMTRREDRVRLINMKSEK